MDAAVAALIGTGIGAAVTLTGTFGVSILQGRRERAARNENAIAQLAEERRIEYIKLLASARELRYIANRKFNDQGDRPVNEVDSLLTQLSTAYYMIALISPEETRRLAWDVRESVFDLWRRDGWESLWHDTPKSDQYPGRLLKARDTTALFRAHVAGELKLTHVSTTGIQAIAE
jgi:type II secretory pathway pseudopilin PulG